MPPHCDSLDGPVVTAARQALDAGDVKLILPFVPASGEDEVRAAFDRVMPLRNLEDGARDVADRWFFETVVRIHRAGEGAPYTGLKPAGLSVGPAIPLAEEAVERGSAEGLADFLGNVLREQLDQRLAAVRELQVNRERSVEDARRYVEAMLGYVVYSHHLYQALRAPTHHGADHHPHTG
jgi:Family of unknown function (DUF6448)